jgi:zinc transport system substrate-binding protein
MVALSKADVFVINGAGMEAFLDRALKRAPRLRVVDASEGIELLRGAGGEANPHVWVSVRLAIRQVRNIARGLETLDPARAPAYAVGASNYVARLEALDVRMREGLSGVAGRDIVTFHEAFPYFARDFGLRVAGVVEREPGSEPGARELAATIETVRRLKVRALFAEPQYPGKCAETIARETGCRVRTLDPVVSGPPDKDAYVAAMERNLTVLQEALR